MSLVLLAAAHLGGGGGQGQVRVRGLHTQDLGVSRDRHRSLTTTAEVDTGHLRARGLQNKALMQLAVVGRMGPRRRRMHVGVGTSSGAVVRAVVAGRAGHLVVSCGSELVRQLHVRGVQQAQ